MASEEITKQFLTFKFRLRDGHAAELCRQARAVNFVWNYCNETQRKAVNDRRRWLSRFELQKLTSGSSKDLDIDGHTIQRICQTYDDARRSRKKSWLNWRTRKSLGWIPFNTGKVTFDGAEFKFRGLRYRTKHLREEMVSGTKIRAGSFNQDSRGRWYINVIIEIECAQTSSTQAVGIDLGLRDIVALSTGEKIGAPRLYRASEKQIATAQRRKKSGRITSINAKVANRRKDFLHKASTKIAKEFGLIVIGDVSPSKLAQTRMAKSVLDAGWSDFKRMLSYKSIRNGGSMLEVSEYLTTQVCSTCGTLPESRPRGIAGLRIREWTCDDCGTVQDRDMNAARNILRIGLDTLAEGAACVRSSQKEAKLNAFKLAEGK